MPRLPRSTQAERWTRPRVLTLFLYHYGAQWGRQGVGGPGRTLGITSAVIWSPGPGQAAAAR